MQHTAYSKLHHFNPSSIGRTWNLYALNAVCLRRTFYTTTKTQKGWVIRKLVFFWLTVIYFGKSNRSILLYNIYAIHTTWNSCYFLHNYLLYKVRSKFELFVASFSVEPWIFVIKNPLKEQRLRFSHLFLCVIL